MTSDRAGHALDVPHAFEASAICDALGVDPDRGLSDPEAEARLAREGSNVCRMRRRPL
jgi:Cation transporter/ATPase, N-terminus